VGRHQAPDAAAVEPGVRPDQESLEEPTDAVRRGPDTGPDQAGLPRPQHPDPPPGPPAADLAGRGSEAAVHRPTGALRGGVPAPAGSAAPEPPAAGPAPPASPTVGPAAGGLAGRAVPGLAAALVPRGDVEATPVLPDVPVGATRADLWPGGAPGYGPQPAGGDPATGSFTRVLLTGLGGSDEPPPPAPPPAPAGPPTVRGRAVATTRRLAARVGALRGDERTALLVVAGVVGVVLLLLALLVVVVRLATGRGGDPAPNAAPPPAASAAPSAAPSASTQPSPTATPSPTGSPLPPSGGSFTSKRSGLCLGAPQGRSDPGAQLVQRACGTDFGTGFLLVGAAQPGLYVLVNAAASRCADVLGASVDNGAPVVQWDCSGAPNETFQLRPVLDPTGVDTGYVQIVAAHSGKCLDVTGGATNEGAPVQQWDCHDPTTEADPTAGGNQSWRFTAD